MPERGQPGDVLVVHGLASAAQVLDDSGALQHYLAEGSPLRSARPPVRVNMRRARWPGPS